MDERLQPIAARAQRAARCPGAVVARLRRGRSGSCRLAHAAAVRDRARRRPPVPNPVQRRAAARVDRPGIMPDPDLLLLDEPAAGWTSALASHPHPRPHHARGRAAARVDRARVAPRRRDPAGVRTRAGPRRGRPVAAGPIEEVVSGDVLGRAYGMPIGGSSDATAGTGRAEWADGDFRFVPTTDLSNARWVCTRQRAVDPSRMRQREPRGESVRDVHPHGPLARTR